MFMIYLQDNHQNYLIAEDDWFRSRLIKVDRRQLYKYSNAREEKERPGLTVLVKQKK